MKTPLPLLSGTRCNMHGHPLLQAFVFEYVDLLDKVVLNQDMP